VCADDDVRRAGLDAGQDGLLVASRCEPAQLVDPQGVGPEPLLERAAVLLAEDGRRHEDRDLLAIQNALERRPNSHLGLAEAHVAADQAVHRLL